MPANTVSTAIVSEIYGWREALRIPVGPFLQHFFDSSTLTRLSQQIDPETPVELDYYPLLAPGERFPINDPDLPPRLTPRPSDDIAFLQGLLWGMSRIEKQGMICCSN